MPGSMAPPISRAAAHATACRDPTPACPWPRRRERLPLRPSASVSSGMRDEQARNRGHARPPSGYLAVAVAAAGASVLAPSACPHARPRGVDPRVRRRAPACSGWAHVRHRVGVGDRATPRRPALRALAVVAAGVITVDSCSPPQDAGRRRPRGRPDRRDPRGPHVRRPAARGASAAALLAACLARLAGARRRRVDPRAGRALPHASPSPGRALGSGPRSATTTAPTSCARRTGGRSRWRAAAAGCI